MPPESWLSSVEETADAPGGWPEPESDQSCSTNKQAAGQVTASALGLLLGDGELAGSWKLDATRSRVRLKSKSMWGLAAVNGAFTRLSGAAAVSQSGHVIRTLTVDAGSVDAKNKGRVEHLRSAEFFDAGSNRAITFTADYIRPSGRGVTVTGQLTVSGQTWPLAFDAAVSVPRAGEVWLDAEVRVNRADFGMTWNQLRMTSMRSTITVHAVFTQQ